MPYFVNRLFVTHGLKVILGLKFISTQHSSHLGLLTLLTLGRCNVSRARPTPKDVDSPLNPVSTTIFSI